jgi:hypothetical protein
MARDSSVSPHLVCVRCVRQSVRHGAGPPPGIPWVPHVREWALAASPPIYRCSRPSSLALPPPFPSFPPRQTKPLPRRSPRTRGDRPPDHGHRHRAHAIIAIAGPGGAAAEEPLRGAGQPGVPAGGGAGGGGERVRGGAGGQDPGERGADAEAGYPRPRAEPHPVRRLQWPRAAAEEARGAGVHRRVGGQARGAVASAEVAQVRGEPSPSSFADTNLVWFLGIAGSWAGDAQAVCLFLSRCREICLRWACTICSFMLFRPADVFLVIFYRWFPIGS